MGYSNAPPVSYLPTLLIHFQPAAAAQLANRLKRAGCPADIAIGCRDAKAAVGARDYGSMVFVGGLSNPAHRRCIAGLRRLAPRTWLIAISPVPLSEADELALRPDIDAFIAFGLRERCPPEPSEGLEPFAAALRRQYGLDFPKFARRIALDSRLRGWQRAFA